MLFKKIAFLLVLLTLLLSSITHASWVKLSSEELIQQTKLAVIGEFIGSTSIVIKADKIEFSAGIIKVEKVENGITNDEFLLIVLRRKGAPRISTDINYSKGQKGLWLLTNYSQDNPTLYSAGHPQRFVSYKNSETLHQLKKLLAKHKL